MHIDPPFCFSDNGSLPSGPAIYLKFMRDRLFCLVEPGMRKVVSGTLLSVSGNDAGRSALAARAACPERLALWLRPPRSGTICACLRGRVESFESPPLKRKNSDRPPSKQPEKWRTQRCAADGPGTPLQAKIAETPICKASIERVSLKSCSGAILNVGLGGAGCVCCLRTQ